MEDGTKILITVGILGLLGWGGYTLYEQQTKGKLGMIIANGMPDASNELISQMSIKEMKIIIMQMIQEGVIDEQGNPITPGLPSGQE